MTEEEAKTWLTEQMHVSRETMGQLSALVDFVLAQASQQNLIAKSTLDHIWARHIVDSAQLICHLPSDDKGGQFTGGQFIGGQWLDLGAGAGFPGIVAAILCPMFHVKLVESRNLRIEYLNRALDHLKISNASVAGMRLEHLENAAFNVISARAFAGLPELLQKAARFSTENTLWLLPKGRNAAKELSDAKGHMQWRGRLNFTVSPSVTDTDAGILVGQLLQAKPTGKR